MQSGKTKLLLQDVLSGYFHQVRIATVTPEGISEFEISQRILIRMPLTEIYFVTLVGHRFL